MKPSKTILILSTLSLIGFGTGYYLLEVYKCGASVFCYFLSIKGEALYYGMGALLLVFLTLAIFPQAYSTWKKFAKWFIPIAALLFITYKGSGYFSPDPEQVFQWVSGIYVILSFIIIAKNVFSQKQTKS